MTKRAGKQLAEGATIIYIAVDGRVWSYLALSDTLRPESTEMIDVLNKLGIQPVLLTVDAADIALVDDAVWELPHLFALSKRMMRTIKLNLTFSMTLNFVAITLAMTGFLNPVIGALVHNAGSVLVIINSALLLKWKNQNLRSISGVAGN